MELLSTVGTIVTIAQDIAGAVATVSRNRSRCRKLAKRVQGIGDLLRELHRSEAAGSGTSTDAATRRLLGRLEDALRRALQLVRSCRGSSCLRSLLAGGRQADRFDEVNGEIDHCLLDLGVATHILIARFERPLLHQNVVRYREQASCSTGTVTIRIGMPCDDGADHVKRCIQTMRGVTEVAAAAASTKDQFRVTVRSGDVDIPSLLEQLKEKLNRNVELVTPAARKVTGGGGGGAVRWDDIKDGKANRGVTEKGGDKQRQCGYASGGGGETKDRDKTAAGVDAGNVTIGVPVHTVNAGMHKLVPPSSYGYGYWAYTQGLDTGGGYHDDAAYHHHHYAPYPDMFSEENPNACAVI